MTRRMDTLSGVWDVNPDTRAHRVLKQFVPRAVISGRCRDVNLLFVLGRLMVICICYQKIIQAMEVFQHQILMTSHLISRAPTGTLGPRMLKLSPVLHLVPIHYQGVKILYVCYLLKRMDIILRDWTSG